MNEREKIAADATRALELIDEHVSNDGVELARNYDGYDAWALYLEVHALRSELRRFREREPLVQELLKRALDAEWFDDYIADVRISAGRVRSFR